MSPKATKKTRPSKASAPVSDPQAKVNQLKVIDAQVQLAVMKIANFERAPAVLSLLEDAQVRLSDLIVAITNGSQGGVLDDKQNENGVIIT